ncbi:hypothetical protein C8R43DRAFT_154635 [Mycena crocata]|nr:hypothetical protein C8R43DRAFT_154635 [Mycena crocata]
MFSQFQPATLVLTRVLYAVPLRVTNPGDRMSVSSSSGSVMEPPKAPALRGSPLRDGVAFAVPASGNAEAASLRMHRVHLPGRTASDSSGASSNGSSRRRKSSKEKKTRIEGPEGNDGQEKILIVLLDGKDKSETKADVDDDATWHGLERRLSTRSARKPSPPGSTNDSPWQGPLENLDEDITYIHRNNSDQSSQYESDSDSDSEYDAGANWGRRGAGAVMPIKSLLTAMGYLTPEAAVLGRRTPGPSPYGSYTTLPGPGPTPYSSPYAGASPYASPYAASLPQASPYQSPYQQPPSRPQTPVTTSGYYAAGGTPPMQSQVPAWASPIPGGGTPNYPPTNYTSPTPAEYMGLYAPANASPVPVGYASPYANANASPYPNATPAPVGYASPYAGAGASPAGGYPNLVAGYSSPYVQPLQRPVYYS